MAENVQRLDLDSFEQSKQRMREIEAAVEEFSTESVGNSGKGRPAARTINRESYVLQLYIAIDWSLLFSRSAEARPARPLPLDRCLLGIAVWDPDVQKHDFVEEGHLVQPVVSCSCSGDAGGLRLFLGLRRKQLPS